MPVSSTATLMPVPVDFVHAEGKCVGHGLNGVVSAIGVSREIRFTHAANDGTTPSAVGDSARERQKNQVAPGNERVRQTTFSDLYLGLSCECCVADAAKDGKVDDMIITQFTAPVRRERSNAIQYVWT